MEVIESKNNKSYSMIDVCKLMCALLIIELHTKPFSNIFVLDQGFSVLNRFGVPYFFCVSGFFLVNKNGKVAIERLKKQLFRIIVIALFWQVSYVIFVKPEYVMGGV